VLAPAYDLLSTFVYRKTHNLTRKMAMTTGGEYRPEYVRARHLDRLFDEAGLGAAAARRRLRGMARDAPGAARNVRQQLIDTGWDAPVLGRIVELIDERARWLLDPHGREGVSPRGRAPDSGATGRSRRPSPGLRWHP
jgi:hypothetical protein